jgi:hypothetical protein
MTQVLVTKPNALTSADKCALRKAGVVPIEADNPEDVRLIQTEGPALAHDDMLYAAMVGANWDVNSRVAFTKALHALVEMRWKRQANRLRHNPLPGRDWRGKR